MTTHANRYIRQTNLPQVGDEGQQKLSQARVLVIGAGGLGCAILPYLVAAGVGTIGVVDGDAIETSNLHRQVLYTEKNVGKLKVVVAHKKLRKQNSTLKINAYPEFLDAHLALDLFPNYDIIVDATDTIGMRYLINDACVLTHKPFVYGSVYRFEGQVSVFNYQNGPTYRCLFKNEKGIVQNCTEVGVLGTTVGLVGMLQASEVLKMILGTGNVLSGKLLMYNALTSSQDIFNFKKDITLNIDEAFYDNEYFTQQIDEISAAKALEAAVILLDVREWEEQPQIEHEKVIQIPLSVLENEWTKLDSQKEIALFCQSGKRSLQACKLLQKHGFKKVKSIREGAVVIEEIIMLKRFKIV